MHPIPDMAHYSWLKLRGHQPKKEEGTRLRGKPYRAHLQT
jgi:hypothetical protein